MPDLGRTLVVLGVAVVVVGLVLMMAPSIPWLGKLPGDVHVRGERFTFYFPIVTCLVVSVLLTVVVNLFFRN
jgi:hypothetical protein